MAKAGDLAAWASDIQDRDGKLTITLRPGLELNGVLNLLRTKDLSNVRGLRVPGSVGLSGLRMLVSNEALTGLVSLAIQGFEDADDAVDVVFESPAIASLRVLKVWVVSDAFDARLGRGSASSLRQLDVRNSHDLTSLDRYFESESISSLRYLTLNRTGLTDATMLFQNRAIENLRGLSLAACDFDSETVDHLVQCPYLGNLRKLNLSHNPQDDVFTSIYELLNAGRLQSLETLRVCGCEIESFDWRKVHFPLLKHLDLRDNPMGLDELLEVLDAPGLPSLEKVVAYAPAEFVPADIDSRLVIDDRTPPWA